MILNQTIAIYIVLKITWLIIFLNAANGTKQKISFEDLFT